LPVLDEGEMKLMEMELLIQLFLTTYYHMSNLSSEQYINQLSYRKGIGEVQATVPWTSLFRSKNVYVNQEYIPDRFTFKEPSKLSKAKALNQLKCWYNRQTDSRVKTVFQFWRV